jgi:hypothetical protein
MEPDVNMERRKFTREFEFGAHITGFRSNAFEWSAGGGWATDSNRRCGPYLRLGVSVKY